VDWKGWLIRQWKESDRLTAALWAVVLGAVVMRSLPGWTNPAWGNDYGIYFGITQDFVDHPQFFRPYTGWGTSYVYFPVLYATTAAVHGLTGLDVAFLMPKVAPVFGGLTALVVYLIVKNLFGKREAALLSAAFLAANPFQLYQTSHAAPMTMGHFFLCLSILLFIMHRKDRFWTGPLYISTAILIGSHHLGTYFYILFVFTALLWRNLQSDKWTENLREELFYFLATVTLTFCYWILIATPVFRADFASALPIGSWTTVGLFYILVAGTFALIPLLRRSERFRRFVGWKLWWPTPREDAVKVGATAAACIAFSAVFTFIPIYGSNFTFLPAATAFLLPLFVVLGLSVVGYRYLDRFPDRAYVKAWLLSITASFLFALITRNQAIYSFRHLEYFAYPLSILAGAAAWEMWGYLKLGAGCRVQGAGETQGAGGRVQGAGDGAQGPRVQWSSKQRWFALGVVALVLASGATAYSVQSTTSQYEESISPEVFEAADWMKENVHTNLTVASDHRVSQIVWSRGFKVTSDEAYWIFFAENWTGALGELNGTGKTYGKVGFVVIDDVMRGKGVQSNLNETPRPITDTYYAKFSQEPFKLLYRAQGAAGSRWAEVYGVDWSYIDRAIG
jgi:4-amino-4-deoxy-L-arabinose transferase-like glycosyltransferase